MASRNPLYPGYYPGEKIEPRSSGNYREYKPDRTPKHIDEFLSEIGGALNVPKWAWEQEKKAMELAWQANFYGNELVTPTEASTVSEEEIEDIPGSVAVGGTLNPAEWVKDPKKQAKNMFVKPVTSIFDKDDFYQKAKQNAWQNTLLVDKEDDKWTSPYSLGNGPRIDREVVVSMPGGELPSTQTKHVTTFSKLVEPDFIKDGGVYGDTLYGEVASAASNYMGQSNVMFFRNGKFNEVNKKILSNLDKELELRKDLFDKSQLKALEDFRKKIRVADAFDTIGVTGGTKGKGLAKVSINGTPITINDSGVTSIRDSLGDTLDVYNKSFFKKNISAGEWDKIGNHLVDLSESLEHTKGLLEGVSDVDSLKKYIGSLEKKLSKAFIEDGAGNLVLRQDFKDTLRKGFFNGLEVEKKKLYRNTVDNGILGGFVKEFVDNNIGNNNSKISKVINAKSKDTGSFIMSQDARRLGLISKGPIGRDWKRQTARDLADALVGGKLPSQFIWVNVISPRIQKWTPSYLIGQSLKRSHYFGLLADKDVLKGDLKPNKIGKFIENKILSNNKFKVKAGGVVYKFKGSSAFKSVVEVAKIFNDKKLKLTEADLIKFLNGGGKLTKEDFDNLKDLKEAILKNKKLRDALGITVLPDGTLEGSGKALAFLENFSGENLRKLGIKPDIQKVGLLQWYGSKLSKLRDRVYNSKVGKVFQKTVSKYIVLKEKIIKALSSLIAKALDVASGGAAVVIDWLVRIAVELVIKRVEKFIGELWKAIKSGDFSGLMEDIEKSFISVLKGCLVAVGIIALPFALVTFIIITVLSTYPSFNVGRIGEDVVGKGSIISLIPSGISGSECSNADGSMGPNTASNPIASAAYGIVAGLQPGFWGGFNKHPNYPELFDDAYFAANPNPPYAQAQQHLMFWCTFLPWKAGYGGGLSWGADEMHANFASGASGSAYVSGSDAYVDQTTGESNIFAGDVIFFPGHVAIVYEVSKDFVTIVQSNACVKMMSFPVSDSGSILGVGSYAISGFGR